MTPRARPFRLVAFEPSEFDLQCNLVEALRKFAAPDCLWLHIGNGERRDVITGSRLKRMGLRAGAADLLFVRAGAPPLFLEAQDLTRDTVPVTACVRGASDRGRCAIRNLPKSR